MTDRFLSTDVLVVGASLAGSTTAYLLGAAGRSVVLADPQAFPRHKACGEGLSILGKRYLESMGLWSEQLAQMAYPFYGYRLHFCDGRRVELKEAVRPGNIQGYGISRVQLDAHVHSSAMLQPSVEPLQKSVHSISKLGPYWVARTQDNQLLQARQLVLACGPAVTNLSQGLEFSESSTSRYGLAFWCSGDWDAGVPTEVQIFHRPEGQYLITPLSQDKINFSILLDREAARGLSKNAIQNRALEILKQSGYRPRSVSGIRGAAKIHAFQLRSVPEDLFIVGDAVERMDPIGGMGMTHALYSASLAAETLLKGHSAASYFKRRATAVKTLRCLTGLSSLLNVSQARLVKLLTASSPSTALLVTRALQQLFPKPYFALRQAVHRKPNLFFESVVGDEEICL